MAGQVGQSGLALGTYIGYRVGTSSMGFISVSLFLEELKT